MCRQFTVTVSSCGHYRRRRFSHRRVGASTSVKSRAQCGPRPSSRSAHRRDVCPGGGNTAGALTGRLRRRAPRRSSHAVARRARAGLPASPRPPRRLAREFERSAAGTRRARVPAGVPARSQSVAWRRRVDDGSTRGCWNPRHSTTAASFLRFCASDRHATRYGGTCHPVTLRRENRPNLTKVPRT